MSTASLKSRIRASRESDSVSHATDTSDDLLTIAEVHAYALDEFSVSTLISFFKLLDRWDRERKSNAKKM